MSGRAQLLTGSYFFEGMQQRSELNPALTPEWSYVSVAGLGGAGVSYRGNTSLQDFIFPRLIDGQKTDVTWMHPSVSLDQLRFQKRYKLSEDLRLPLVGVGFKALGGFNTIGLNLRQSLGVSLPGDLFSLVKQIRNQDYMLGDLGVRAMAWGEIALGHSHKIGDWRVGGKVKLLLGMGRADAEVSDLSLQLASTNRWHITGSAMAQVNVPGFGWGITNPKTFNGQTHQIIAFDGMQGKVGFSGIGLGFDLGAEYDMRKIAPGLKISAAVTDLGFISWSGTHVAKNVASDRYITGLRNIKIGDKEAETIGDQLRRTRDNIVELISLEEVSTSGGRTTALAATLNVGVEYRLPMFEPLKFGLLSTTRIDGQYSWNEERLSANLTPLSWLDLSVSAGLGTYGASVGWLVNFHPKVFNFFVGMDHTFDNIGRPFVPLNQKGDAYCGINFTW